MQSLSSTALTPYQAPALQVVQSAKFLVIVDPAVKDFSIVVHGLDAAELLVLDAHQAGIGQISVKLQSCSAIERIHIVAPSCPGVVKLGDTCLDAVKLEIYRTEIETWRQALSPNSSILLHGQTIAMGTVGMAFVGRLSQLTGAVVVPASLPTRDSSDSRFNLREFVRLAG